MVRYAPGRWQINRSNYYILVCHSAEWLRAPGQPQRVGATFACFYRKEARLDSSGITFLALLLWNQGIKSAFAPTVNILADN